MFSNLTGIHLAIVIAVVLIPLALAAVVVMIVLIIVRRSRTTGSVPASGDPAQSDDPSARLEQLDELHRRAQITDDEYESRRHAIVDRL